MRKLSLVLALLLAMVMTVATGCEAFMIQPPSSVSSMQQSMDETDSSSLEKDSSQYSSEEDSSMDSSEEDSSMDSSEDSSSEIEPVNQYTVTFKDENGTVLYLVTLNEGERIVYEGATPTKTLEGYTYTFVGWTDGVNGTLTELPVATKDVVYTAMFSETRNTYTVTWLNYDGTELEQDASVPYGTVPTYNSEEPVRTETGATYTFIGWATASNATQAEILTTVTKNTVYYAVFTSVADTYTVTWVVNGVTVETDTNVPHGSFPTYNGATPTKAETEQYTYEHSGWSPELVAVTEDATYTATFSEHVKTYTVKWLNWDGSVLWESVTERGSKPQYKGARPTRTDNSEEYAFLCWTPNIVVAMEDTCYTANYIEKDIEYSDFGAVGNGSADDFEALYKAHAYANATEATKVVAQRGKTYYICNTVPSEKLVEWANGIKDGAHETAYNCNYGANVKHINGNGLYTDCHGNVVTDALKTWISSNLSSMKGNKALSIPVLTDVVWTNAKFTIDDTNVAPLVISGTTATAPADKQYSTDIFQISSGSYTITESLTGNQYNTTLSQTMTTDDFNALLTWKKNLKALNEQIQTTGIGPNTKKLNIAPGYPATVILFNEGLTVSATRLIANKSVEVSPQQVYIRYGGNANSGAAKRETVLIDANGNIDPSTPIMFDYTRLIQVVICDMNAPTLTVTGGEFTTLASQADVLFGVNSDGTINNAGTTYTGAYLKRGLMINRSNVLIDGVTHYVKNEFSLADYGRGLHGAHYSGFFSVSACGNVTLENCVLTGRRNYDVSGSYDFSANNVCGIYLKNCTQTNFWITESASGEVAAASKTDANAKLGMDNSSAYPIQIIWGIGGTNCCKNMEYYDCTLSRFDAHQGLYNGKIVDSTITLISVIGMGDLIIENTEILCARPSLNGNAVVNLRNDYGSTWDGDIYIRNVRATTYGGTLSTFAIAYYQYNNHYFGYECHLPNLHIEDFTLTNASVVKTLYLYTTSTTSSIRYSSSMHSAVLSDGSKNMNIINMPELVEIDDISKYDYIISYNEVGESFNGLSIVSNITVNHRNADGSLIETETVEIEYNTVYTVAAKTYPGKVASHDVIKGCYAQDGVAAIDIYYSTVTTWNGTDVSTAFTGGGTQTNPYLIQSGADLLLLANKVNAGTTYEGKYFKLVNSIDLNNNSITIGYYNAWNDFVAFGGILDGNHCSIRGLKIANTNGTNSTAQGSALFGSITGTISNLTVYGSVTTNANVSGGIAGCVHTGASLVNCASYVNISGLSNVGGVVGSCDGTLNACASYGTVAASSWNSGGITGLVSTTGEAKYCVNYANVTSVDAVGGVAGASHGSINHCVNYASVKGSAGTIGGILGNMPEGSVVNCTNYGEISGTNHVAGIVGNAPWREGSTKTISSCVNRGTILNSSYFGAGIFGAGDQLTVSNCKNTGAIGGAGDCVGGIAGAVYAGTTVTNCTNMNTVKGKTNLGGIAYSNTGTIKNCTNTGDFVLTTTTGSIAADGIVHTNTGTVTGCTSTVTGN